VVTHPVHGPWSLATSARFWEEFTPTAIEPGAAGDAAPDHLETSFLSEADWTPAHVRVTQEEADARLELTGSGDLDTAAHQAARFLSIDVDATTWPEVGERDPVIAEAQRLLPGFRPCGFTSPDVRPST
jgi:DNA-3-methyladenine glycosylase II